MSAHSGFMDELERDLGLPARLRVIATAGGQRRHIPLPDNALTSKLAGEIGADATFWLAGRFGGDILIFPSKGAGRREHQAALLRAAVLEAGLTDASRSANDIAAEFGVHERHVRAVRKELREDQPAPELPLFTFNSVDP